MSSVKKVISIWKEIFSKKEYLFIVVVIAIFFYILNIFISNFWMIINFYKTYDFSQASISSLILILNFRKNILFFSFLSLVIISILSSILFSLIIYNFKSVRKRIGD